MALRENAMRHLNKSKVNIRKSGKGYLIEIDDGMTNPIYAITKDELEQIVLYGKTILEEK